MHSEFSGYGTAEIAAESVVNFCRCAGHEVRLKRTSADYNKSCQRVLSDSCDSGFIIKFLTFGMFVSSFKTVLAAYKNIVWVSEVRTLVYSETFWAWCQMKCCSECKRRFRFSVLSQNKIYSEPFQEGGVACVICSRRTEG